MEIWKDIEGYEGLYQVSNTGRVRNSSDRILKPYKNSGYAQVRLWKNNTGNTCYIHRLVAQAFIPNEEGKKEVDHINTIRDDNRVENLRWATRKENVNNVISRNKYSNIRIGMSTCGKRVICEGQIYINITECASYYNEVSRNMCRWLDGTRTMPQRFIDMGLSYVDSVMGRLNNQVEKAE